MRPWLLRPSKVHFSRLYGLTLRLCIALAFVLGYVVSARRNVPRNFICLRFDRDNLIDVLTGFHVFSPRPDPPVSAYQPTDAISPDGKFKLSLQGREPGIYALVVEPRLAAGDLVVIEEGMTGRIDYTWSPDSTRIAYTWTDTRGRPFGAIARPSALSEKKQLPGGNVIVGQGWSPDSAQFLFEEVGKPYLTLWSADRFETLPLSGYLMNKSWSPDNKWFAYLYADAKTTWLTLHSSADRRDITFGLTGPVNSPQFFWSPNGQYVALQYFARWPYFQIGVYGVDRSERPALSEVALRGDSLSNPFIVWSKDSRALVFMDSQSRWDLRAYYPAEKRFETVVAGVAKAIRYAPGSSYQRIAVVSQASQIHLSVMEITGSGRIDLVRDADDMGDPYWSPDGHYVTVVWATGQGEKRRVRLSWLGPDDRFFTLDDGFWDMRDLSWVRGGQYLAYVAVRGGSGPLEGKPAFSVEIVDLKAGAIRQLVQNLAQITMFHYDESTATFTFWWRDAAEQIGTDGYKVDGTRIFHYLVEPGYSIEGKIDPNPYVTIIEPGSPRIFPAPNDSVAVLKLGPLHDESLHLSTADGTWRRVLRTGLYGLGDPLWSPDGSMFAITEARNRGGGSWGPITLSVFRVDGTEVNHFSQYNSYYSRLAWNQCE